MLKFWMKKISEILVIMFLISMFAFTIIYMAPGDVSVGYITDTMTEEEINAIKAELGVDKSLPEQYINWASKALQGDLGISLVNKTPVKTIIMKRLPATMLLMGSALGMSILLAIPLGLWAGYKVNSKMDYVISGFTYFGKSIPGFCLGMILIIMFAGKVHLFPTSGMRTPGVNSVGDVIMHLFLPCSTLCLGMLATYIRYIRTNTIGQLSEEYAVTAKAKGNSNWQILTRHVLKNTLLPVITILGMSLPQLVGGSFVIETVFGWPGLGTLVMQSIGARDYPVIMAYILISGLLLVVGNMGADLLYSLVDPRIKMED